MSPHPHHEIDRARQCENAPQTINAHHGQDARAITERRRPVRRLLQTVAALGVCLTATVALTGSGAHANPRPVKADGRMSAQQPAREIAALEAKGYAPVACTIGGTLMRNHHTGQSMVVTQ